MKKDPKVFLHHILESISLIESYSNGKTLEDFMASTSLQDMIIRRIEIIGEAAKNISDDFRALHPEIDWRGMAGLRDILIHQYFGIDLLNVWNISQTQAPDALSKIQALPEYQTARQCIEQELE